MNNATKAAQSTEYTNVGRDAQARLDTPDVRALEAIAARLNGIHEHAESLGVRAAAIADRTFGIRGEPAADCLTAEAKHLGILGAVDCMCDRITAALIDLQGEIVRLEKL